MKVDKNNLKIGSICCGMGGFDQGLKSIGFETVWALDIMEDACNSFKANHPSATVLCKDAHLVDDFSSLGSIDGLVFGPPCQGFSRANSKRSMGDPRNYVYLATLKAVQQTNAQFFIFENVVGLLDMYFDDGSSVFEKIKQDYENCGSGYTISYKVIDCANVGVPQLNRLRLIMIGVRKDISFKYEFLPEEYGDGRKPYKTLKDTIWHLRNVDQTGSYYNEPYDWKYLSRKRQKSWNEPSYTIEASARYAKLHPDGGRMKWISTNKWDIPSTCRRFSIMESKLIQTFPEDYIVTGSLEQQYVQIGNAVPPLLAEYVGTPIATYFLAERKYEKELKILAERLKAEPGNSFYKSLLNWIKSGKELTERQLKYIV